MPLRYEVNSTCRSSGVNALVRKNGAWLMQAALVSA
jgi:hypothetical protein